MVNELVLTLMIWVSQATGLSAPQPPPIVLTTQMQMVLMTYGCDQSPVMLGNEELCESIDKGVEVPEVIAAYDNKEGIIYLREDWIGVTIKEKSILLHELVHHMQYKSGKTKKICTPKLEDQAYKLQDKWLKEQGSTLEKEIEIGGLFLLMITQCEILPLMWSGPLGN